MYMCMHAGILYLHVHVHACRYIVFTCICACMQVYCNYACCVVDLLSAHSESSFVHSLNFVFVSTTNHKYLS